MDSSSEKTLPTQPMHCCGVPAAHPSSPAASAWDAMSEWYLTNMSRATASLHFSMANQLGLLSGLDVLETHCADAYGASIILSSVPGIVTYTGVDFSERMVTAAIARLGDRARVFRADSCSLPFADASFDRYISNLGLCCVQDVRAALASRDSALWNSSSVTKQGTAHRLAASWPKRTEFFVLVASRRCLCASSVAWTTRASSSFVMLLSLSVSLHLLTGECGCCGRVGFLRDACFRLTERDFGSEKTARRLRRASLLLASCAM